MEQEQEPRKVETVSEFLEKISACIEEMKIKKVAFRGEREKYQTPCWPTLFRSDEYKNQELFERKMLDKYISTYKDNFSDLYNTINLQHGRYPSRLLDITFNALIALFFAVEDDEKKDAYVYLFDCERMVPATSAFIEQLFSEIVNNKPWTVEPVMDYGHVIIDHIQINDRIKVQQGGFILFTGVRGNAYIERYKKGSVVIDGTRKEAIRKELEQICGINSGYIYPEAEYSSKIIPESVNYYDYSPVMDKIEFLKRAINNFFEEKECIWKKLYGEIIDLEPHKVYDYVFELRREILYIQDMLRTNDEYREEEIEQDLLEQYYKLSKRIIEDVKVEELGYKLFTSDFKIK